MRDCRLLAVEVAWIGGGRTAYGVGLDQCRKQVAILLGAGVLALLQPAKGIGLSVAANPGLAGHEHCNGQYHEADKRQAVVADLEQAVADVTDKHGTRLAG